LNWQEYIPYVIIPNLAHRTDRKDRMVELCNEYGIAGNFWEAVRCENQGAIGLMLTMKEIFNWCLDNGIDRVMILEDDCEMLVSPDEFHSIMNKCFEDLNGINWQIFYLGLQHVIAFKHWITPNILPVQMGYSTHAVVYNKHAMHVFVNAKIDEPIDNWLCREYHKYNTSFCSYPMLCSQIEDFSDIGGQFTSWKKDLEGKFDKNVISILPQRFN
jgi:hypothetical protein